MTLIITSKIQINLTSRISRQLASSFGNKIDCLLIPKLNRTTSNRTTKYIIFFTILPIIVTSGPVYKKDRRETN